MTASASAMMSFSRSIAAGFSILASSDARSPISERASATSSGRCTNDNAIQSVLLLERELEVDAVLFGQRRDRNDDVGHVDALVVRDPPADLDLGDDLVAVGFEHLQPDLAVVDQDVVPGLTASNSSGWGSSTRFESPASLAGRR